MEQHCALRLWITEYAWGHNMIDVFQDEDWGILSLDESWRVRVVSAQVYAIVKSRQTHHYERVLAFLEHIHTLLPALVPAIKHMKIVFGLKTMNHLEKQYGDHYAHKIEERLLHYLRELDKTLPKCTYIDKIMKKSSPLKEWEKALLDLITNNSATRTTRLKTLLHSDVSCCFSHLGTRTTSCMFPESCACVGTSKETPNPVAEKSTEVECAITDTIMVDIDGPKMEQALNQQTDQRDKTTYKCATKTDNIEESSPKNSSVSISPHFCSKHQRWVRNILCECPGECSEEPPEISPLLFTSSSSSSDLTPSNLTTLPQHQLSPSTSNQTVENHAPEPEDLGPQTNPSPPAVIKGRFLKVVIVPCMNTTPRMSIEECLKVTKGRSQARQCDDIEEHDVYFYDVNALYSDSSSEESDSDTDASDSHSNVNCEQPIMPEVRRPLFALLKVRSRVQSSVRVR
ncbi:hypothetical protein WMY93_024056 [Mugilogobius chulae]|uniref:TERF1-interacting nuclear factor 2 N-terminal domain-containing protein n=1 Tax=Mugilogobius chulae TaxID=88201 RepID=A0AAW0N5Z1_9GOBI